MGVGAGGADLCRSYPFLMHTLFLWRAGWLLPILVLLATLAHAQREGDRSPTQDPFGRRPVLAREAPGGRYLSHSYQNGVLTIRATDGSTRQIQPWTKGVVKISYFAPGRRPVADSSVSVVQMPVRWHSPDLNGEGPEYGSPPAMFRRWRAALATGNVQQTNSTLTWPISGYSQNSSEQVVVDKNTLRITLLKGTAALFSEAGPAFRRLPPTARARRRHAAQPRR